MSVLWKRATDCSNGKCLDELSDLAPSDAGCHVTHLLSRKQSVDVFNCIEISSIEWILTGKHLQTKGSGGENILF